MIAAAELDASIGMAPSLPSCAAVAPHTSLRTNQLHHRNRMLLGKFAAIDVGRHIIALVRLVHGIINLDLSTVEVKTISEAFVTHTLAGFSNTLLCRSLPPGSVLRPAVASALDALLKRYAQSIEGAMNVSAEY